MDWAFLKYFIYYNPEIINVSQLSKEITLTITSYDFIIAIYIFFNNSYAILIIYDLYIAKFINNNLYNMGKN